LKTRSEIHALRDVLQTDRFDVCVDMQGALKSAMVGRMAGATVFAGPAAPRERVARWLYKQQVEMPSAHVVEQGCELLGAAVSEVLHPARVTLPMDEMDERWATEAVGCERFCLISPGGGWGAKIWPAERFGRVAAELARAGVQSVVNTSQHGSREAERVVQASDGTARVVQCSVGQLIALTRRAAVVVAGRYRATASGGCIAEAGGGDLWADRPGAQWAVWDALTGAARCRERDQPQAGARGGGGNVADRGGRGGDAAKEMMGSCWLQVTGC